jgi:hypothetical protein
MQPMVEAAFTDHLWHVAVLLVEEPAGFVDVGAEEGCSYQWDSHDFGCCKPNLGIVVEAVDGLQEVLTQAVDGDYGIVDHILLILKEGWVSFESGGYYYQDRGQLGLGLGKCRVGMSQVAGQA